MSYSPLFIRPASTQQDAAPSDSAEWVELINQVYLTSESEFWKDGYYRISEEEYLKTIAAGQFLFAFLEDKKAGCVKVRRLEEDLGDFGMLITHPNFRKHGIGGKLVDAAEAHLAQLGCKRIRLEVLKPIHWLHEEKEFLDRWYRKLGYSPIDTIDFFEAYPRMKGQGKTELEFVVYEKGLPPTPESVG